LSLISSFFPFDKVLFVEVFVFLFTVIGAIGTVALSKKTALLTAALTVSLVVAGITDIVTGLK
jgi:small neutral amino acid transporter SnatA (MarC family)